ncbi:hypothetical protein NIES4106_03530 [Fischerella sp. NIES-4106]|nr:hypothetical protein NIES4106_03530 [Fischerella sp. NIES-4106]
MRTPDGEWEARSTGAYVFLTATSSRSCFFKNWDAPQYTANGLNR